MSNTKYPLILNGIKFQVNPTSLSVTKPILKAKMDTMSGTRFQIWYNQAEVLTIKGVAAGETAYRELLFLKQQYERTSSTAVSELYYKTKIYRGFIDTVGVGHATQTHQRFPYDITFQLLYGQQFNIHDMALEPKGVVGEASSFLEENINAPIARVDKLLGQGFGNLF